MPAAVEVVNVARRFGTVQALAGVDLDRRGGRVLRPAGPERRRQDDADLDPRRAHPRRRRARRASSATTSSRDYRDARRKLGVVPQELVFDPFFTVRETLAIQSGYFGIRDNDAWIDEILHHLDLTRQGQRQHALALGRDEAPRAGRPGAGAQAAGHHPGRADRRRRRRAAPEPVGVHPQAEPRRPHDHPDDALPRGGRGAVRPHRDAEGRQGRGARHQAGAAVALRRPHRAPRRRARARRVAGPRAAAARAASSSSGSTATPTSRRCSRRCAPRASPSPSSRCRRPTSSRCSCGSWPTRSGALEATA